MIFTLIALVLLLVGAAALLRTIDSTSILVGNLAFRRDLTNRAETAIVAARTVLVSGVVSTPTLREQDNVPGHYYASKLGNASNGVPSVLMKTTSGYDAAYGVPATSTDGITLRWVIDRQCVAAGSFNTSSCQNTTATTSDPGGAGGAGPPVAGTKRPVYRISVRVTGPRGTEAFYQTTYAD
jgi:hypothetical protein